MTRRHVVPTLVGAIAVVGVSLSGCTPAFDPNSSGFGGVSASPVEVVVAGDSSGVAQVAEAYQAATGSSVDVVAAASGEGDSLEWDSTSPSAVQIGREYWCVIADQAWFSVNKVSPPASLSDLQSTTWAPLLSIEDPSTTPMTMRWLSGLPDAQAFLKQVSASGAQLGTGTDSARLRIASALEPWRTVNNLKTSSDWITLPDTCVEATLSVSVTGDGAQALVDYLLSADGQTALVEASEAYPLDSAAALPSAIETVAPVPSATMTVQDNESVVTEAWNAATKG